MLIACIAGAGVAVAQTATRAAPALVTRDLGTLQAGLVTLRSLLARITRAGTGAERARLQAAGDAVIRTDLASLAAIHADCAAGPPVSSVVPGGAPAKQGTPLPPSIGTPFPFSGGAAPMP